MKQTFGATTVTTPNDHQILMERDFDLTAAQLFAAHTEPDLIRRWMSGMPGWSMPVCEVDLRVGGQYRWEWAHPEGHKMGVSGTFKEVVRNERIVQTEAYDEPWYPGGCEVSISVSDESPNLVMLLTYEEPEARDISLKTGVAGVEDGYKRIETLFD